METILLDKYNICKTQHMCAHTHNVCLHWEITMGTTTQYNFSIFKQNILVTNYLHFITIKNILQDRDFHKSALLLLYDIINYFT